MFMSPTGRDFHGSSRPFPPGIDSLLALLGVSWLGISVLSGGIFPTRMVYLGPLFVFSMIVVGVFPTDMDHLCPLVQDSG